MLSNFVSRVTTAGQVKTLNKEQRHLFCKIIIALAEENKETVVALMKEAGFQSKHMDPNIIYLYAKVCYDEDNKELTNGKHIQLFMEDIQNMDPIIHLPSKSINSIEPRRTFRWGDKLNYCCFFELIDSGLYYGWSGIDSTTWISAHVATKS